MIRVMSQREYDNWMSHPIAREASLPSFFPSGVNRTKRILKGTATKKEVGKWKSFKARHYSEYKRNPTARRRIAILNWGYYIPIARNEKFNLAKMWERNYNAVSRF
jgi:hypothetical protein